MIDKIVSLSMEIVLLTVLVAFAFIGSYCIHSWYTLPEYVWHLKGY